MLKERLRQRILSLFPGEKVSGSTISIEPLEESEISPFLALLFKEIIGGLDDGGLPERESHYSKFLKEPEKYTFLAAKDKTGKIVGGIHGQINEFCGKKAGHVDYVFVDPQKRRRGIALKLYQAYEEILLKRGDIFYLWARIRDENVPSLQLHKKMGITQVCGSDGDMTSYYKAIK